MTSISYMNVICRFDGFWRPSSHCKHLLKGNYFSHNIFVSLYITFKEYVFFKVLGVQEVALVTLAR